ncbi:Zn-dependent hydrolase [Rhizobiales bacterium]|uniref:Zn-dependent hydrolase n=1 Tax=Hongsoonwoonella zoysiae TaxID=2821844 RepID=UPI00156125D3|nr:Zn-dependent hydrolase [Hongsoonwoonella zoysiae]NRG16404.1 Zn-dependent hydrolase [Hongsoonwoonella zoysiae]
MPSHRPVIDGARLRKTLDGINAFGHNPQTGGYNRQGFSDADMAVRRWFEDEARADGFKVRRDAAANVFVRYGPENSPCIMSGSHLDTVPEGGAFDGALGVAVAWEALRAMRDAGMTPKIAVEAVATAEEEGRFGGMLGSQAITGQVTRDWIEQAADASGETLVAAMRGQGLDPYAVLDAARPAGSIKAFVELHIEQGPVLEANGNPIGIAHSVSGVSYIAVRMEGRANHSGTTPMHLRADAFRGLTDVAVEIPNLIEKTGTDQSRITIGKVDLEPNFPHTIPGFAEFTVIIRDTDETVMRALTDAVKASIEAAARRHGLSHVTETKSWLVPVALDNRLAELLSEEAGAMGLAALPMPSGAGHDAQTMQSLCPSALIFVPSRNGISHAPEEWTDWSDIEKGAQLVLNALVRLSCETG